ncbi:MAG: 16S rRNA (cytosine(967)-C(5))-methyltransferase RsmB [Verrucomicrobia bacterium]|nr:16S rRNA (cytosine(967)-C(5))-methyltransferase RsmB [Verrucomicrobiota bacterium]
MLKQKPREIAADVLRRRARGEDYLENLIEAGTARAGLSPADRGLVQELTCGVVRWQATLDWLIDRKTTSRPQKPTLQILLQLGLYQIFWLDRIPNHASVHETVELAKQLGFVSQAGFINAILRSYVREETATRQLLADLKNIQPALGYSHPEWLLARWQTRWDAAKLRALLGWNNTPPFTFARVNTFKTSTPQLLAQWQAEGVAAEVFHRDWIAGDLIFQLKSHPPLSSLPSFREGKFYVQDPGTLLAVAELEPQPGETILDVCAAPGGKTTFIAQCMKSIGSIVATDTSSDRLKLLQENCARLGASCVQAKLVSASSPPDEKLFDRILIDAPCSNTGVLRRRVDLRWRIRPEEIDRLQDTQRELLQRAASQLQPGGTLVYSTCSLEPEENEQVVQTFLASHPDFALVRERQLLPFADGVDGAYVARLVRRHNQN